MLPRKRFYFIRHGETDFNRLHQFQGHTDVPINARGRRQAEAERERVGALDIDEVFSSPLCRALETARILVAGRPVGVIEDLKECGCPETAARIYLELGLGVPDFKKATVAVPESPEDFQSRSLRGVAQALRQTEGTALVVAHGGTYWALCRELEQPPGRIPNCAPVLFEPVEGGWSVDSF